MKLLLFFFMRGVKPDSTFHAQHEKFISHADIHAGHLASIFKE